MINRLLFALSVAALLVVLLSRGEIPNPHSEVREKIFSHDQMARWQFDAADRYANGGSATFQWSQVATDLRQRSQRLEQLLQALDRQQSQRSRLSKLDHRHWILIASVVGAAIFVPLRRAAWRTNCRG